MAGGQYAQGTDVSVGRSIGELERLVAKHGATGFGYGTDDVEGYSQVVFRIDDRLIRFRVTKPNPGEFTRTPTGRPRSAADARRFATDEERRLWRALVLVIKALLVAVADGVIDLSEAFMPYMLLANGQTIAEWTGPQLDTIYATNTMPAILPGAGDERRAITG
jgi:hypothetical protein